jgi:hypothetical protein
MLLMHKAQSEHAHAGIRSDMFIRVCKAFDAANLNWCIVCGHKNYPEDVKPHDVDVLVDPHHFRQAGAIIGRTLRVAQCIMRESNAWRFETFRYADDGSAVLLSFDLFADIRYPGGVLMRADEFLKGRQRSRDLFWIPPAHAEFGYYLLKKLEKSSRVGEHEFDASHGKRLSELFRADEKGGRAIAQKMLGGMDADLAISAAMAEDWEAVRSARKRLFNTIQRRATRPHPLSVAGYWITDTRRRLWRMMQPTGLWIIFTGKPTAPDKDIVADLLEPLAPQAFRIITVRAGMDDNYYKAVQRPKFRSHLIASCVTHEQVMQRMGRRSRPDLVIPLGDALQVERQSAAVASELHHQILEFLAARTSRRFKFGG